VIFGEYVPFRDQLSFLSSFNLPSGDLRPGDKIELIESGEIKIGPSICFEALFPDIAMQHSKLGANLLAVMSIDDWFIGTPMMEHLLAGSVYRAIENGLPVVRSSSMGPTCWIDSRGNIRSQAPIGKTLLLRGEVTLPTQGPLPYREVFPILAFLVTGLTLIAPSFKRSPAKASEEKRKEY
jgi:apolipoprotein N-acyltransferase